MSKATREELEGALMEKASLGEIRQLVDSNPGILRETDKDEWTPLHAACYNEAPLEVIQWLVDSFPDALEMKNNNGYTPLHYACSYSAPLEVVKLLVDQFPDAVEMKTEYGDTPLHLACYKKAPFEVIQLLVDRFPGAVEMKDKYGKTPLDYCDADTKAKILEMKRMALQRQRLQQQQEEEAEQRRRAEKKKAEADKKAAALRQKQEAERQQQQQQLRQKEQREKEEEARRQEARKEQTGKTPLDPKAAEHLKQEAERREQKEQKFTTRAELDAEMERLKGIQDAHCHSKIRAEWEKAKEAHLKIAELGKIIKDGKYPSIQEIQEQIDKCDKILSSMSVFDDARGGILEEREKLQGKLDKEKRAFQYYELPRKFLESSNKLWAAYKSTKPVDKVPELAASYLEETTLHFNEDRGEDGRYLGGGGFADVFRGVDTRNGGFEFVVKRHHEEIMNRRLEGEAAQKQLLREVEVLSKLDHPNIVRLLGFCLERHCLVYEYAEAGSLAEILSHPEDRKVLQWRDRLDVVHSVASALNYLHKKNCSHRDVKPDNICFTEDMSRVVLIDFGLARLVNDENYNKTVTNLRGWSEPYTAPEYRYGTLKDQDGKIIFDERCEVYSLGFVIQALITGTLPNPGSTPMSAVAMVNAGQRDAENAGQWDATVLKDFSELAAKCMSPRVTRHVRPDLDGVLNELVKLKEASVPQPTKEQTELFRVTKLNSSYAPTVDAVSISRNEGKCCSCNRTSDRGLVCNRPSSPHFLCLFCLGEHVKMNIGTIDLYCREHGADCRLSEPFTERQLIEHLEPNLADEHFQTRRENIRRKNQRERQKRAETQIEAGNINESLNDMSQQLQTIKAALEKMAENELECPTLYVLSKLRSARGNRRERRWAPKLSNPIRLKKSYILNFICACDGKPINYGIILMKDKAWVRKVAPALRASLLALRLSIRVVVGLNLPVDEWLSQLGFGSLVDGNELNEMLQSEGIDEQLEKLDESLKRLELQSDSDALTKVQGEVKSLCEGGYTAIANVANSEEHRSRWRKEMCCASHSQVGMAWVKKENKTLFEKKIIS